MVPKCIWILLKFSCQFPGAGADSCIPAYFSNQKGEVGIICLPPLTPSLSLLSSLCCFFKKGYLGEKIYLLLSNGKNKPTNQLFILPIGKESKTCLGFCFEGFFFWSSYWKLIGKKSYYWLLIITCCNGATAPENLQFMIISIHCKDLTSA